MSTARERAEALLRLEAGEGLGEIPADLPFVMAREYLALADRADELADRLAPLMAFRTAWRIVGIRAMRGLDVLLTVDTTAPAVVERIEASAAATGIELIKVAP